MNPSPLQLRALLARQEWLHTQHHKTLSRRIHDEISQKLTLLALQISLEADTKRQTRWSQQCKDWASMIMELGQSVREITNDLQPRILDEFGLVETLQWYAHTFQKDVRCTVLTPPEDVALAPLVSTELFGVCRDVVAHILQPAGASHIEIQIEKTDGRVRLHLRGNDKCAGPQPAPDRELDILSIDERLLRLDGAASMDVAPGSGTTITLSVPMKKAA